MTSRWRNRLRVEPVDGSVQLFLVNHLDKVLADLRARVANDVPPPPTDR
jgi:hypothetical protein